MEEFGSKQARWRTTLGNSIMPPADQLVRLVTHELNRVKEHYRDVIETTEDIELLAATLPGELERSLHGAWNELVRRRSTTTSSRRSGSLLEEFGAEGMDAVLGEFEMPEALRELSGSRAPARPTFTLLEDGLPMAMQTFTFANIANAAAGALGLATGGLGLIAYGIGAALAVPIGNMRKRGRREATGEERAQRYVAELLFGQEGVAKEFTTELSLRILDLREEVERFVEQRLADRRKQLEREHRELQTLLRAETRQAPRSRAGGARRASADIGKMRAEIEPLQRAVDVAAGRGRHRRRREFSLIAELQRCCRRIGRDTVNTLPTGGTHMSECTFPESYDDGTDDRVDPYTSIDGRPDGDGFAETTVIDFDGDGVADAYDIIDPITGGETHRHRRSTAMACSTRSDRRRRRRRVRRQVSPTPTATAQLDIVVRSEHGTSRLVHRARRRRSTRHRRPGSTDDVDDDVHGDPMAEIPYHQAQVGANDCLPTSVAMVLTEVTGTEVPPGRPRRPGQRARVCSARRHDAGRRPAAARALRRRRRGADRHASTTCARCSTPAPR